jgi:hypothetical protein
MTRMLIAALAAFLLAASPAAASGKGGGGATTPPAPEPVADPCEPYWALPEIVNRTNGGCVVVDQTAGGTLFLDFVAVNPGWTYTVESGGGTKGRVQISFDGPGGQKASIRVEPGKTDIR